MCRNTRGIGYHIDGAFCEYFAMPATNVWVHPEGMDPDVAAILSRFPGAKITDVRIRTAIVEDDTPSLPAAAESSEGDILPGDDIEF